MTDITQVEEVRITVKIVEPSRGITYKDFYNVQDLAAYLKSQPVVAAAVGYIPKKPQPPKPPVSIDALTSQSRRPSARQVNHAQQKPAPMSKKDLNRLEAEVQNAIDHGYIKDMPADWKSRIK